MRESSAAKSGFGHTDSVPDLVGAPLTLDFTVFEGTQINDIGLSPEEVYSFPYFIIIFYSRW